MSDLIDRAEAKKYILSVQNLGKYYHPKSRNEWIRYTEAIEQLDEVPSATPSATPTERTGHWTYLDGAGIYFDLYSCSECGFLFGTPTFNYCPNCGCRMQESEG